MRLTSVGPIATYAISSVWHGRALSSAVVGVCVAVLSTHWVEDGRTKTALAYAGKHGS